MQQLLTGRVRLVKAEQQCPQRTLTRRSSGYCWSVNGCVRLEQPGSSETQARHQERDLTLSGDAGSEFRLILRQNEVNPFDFSIILAVRVPRSNHLFRIRRYNGKSHEHTNHIEQVTFYDFHIHIATQRYQELGTREDAYAEPTGPYADFRGALRCLIGDTNLDIPPDPQANSCFSRGKL